MPYTQTLIDNFDDGTLDSTRWSIESGPGATESGGTLNLAFVPDYPRVVGKSYFDLSHGMLASKLSFTGPRGANTELYLGTSDSDGNYISLLGNPDDTYLTFQPGGLTTFNNEVISDSSVGIGSGWVNGTWLGIGNMGSSNTVRVYKSSDGQNWAEMARCDLGGTFNKTAVTMIFMAGVWDSSSNSLIANLDDASYWVPEVTTFVTRKVRWGGIWVAATPKVRINGEWVPVGPKPMIDGEWDLMD